MKKVQSGADIKSAAGSDANDVGMIDSGCVDANVKIITKLSLHARTSRAFKQTSKKPP